MEDQSNRVRVLVVDDSILNRRGIRRVLEQSSRVEIAGEAGDGEEALRAVSDKKPDAITLDLEMPRMGGFTFLRLLMARNPLPVIVVSSHSQKENVFRALELGAIDFVEKPERGFHGEWSHETLVDKVVLARTLRLRRPKTPSIPQFGPEPDTARGLGPTPAVRIPPRFVIGIAASTGGPAALLDIFSRLPERLPASVVVVQHMPHRFTTAFAARLDRRSTLPVSEATDAEPLLARRGYVCPGGSCVEVHPLGSELRLRVLEPSTTDAYVPSADRLFTTLARHVGSRAVGIVLTGMGTDGVEGAKAIQAARGLVVVESRNTAVMDGMPAAVTRAGVAARVLPLPAIGELLATLTGA